MSNGAQDQITEIVVWYRDLPSDFLGINELMHKRQQLAGYQVEYAAELGLARQIWSMSKAVYEKTKMQLRVKYKSEGTSNADAISRANSIKELEEQQQAEADFYKMYYQYKSHEEVLSAMNQQIATLREDLNRANFS